MPADLLPAGYSIRYNPWRDGWGFTVSLYRGEAFVRIFNDEGDAIRFAAAAVRP